MRQRLPLQGLTITAALVLGFGLTLGLWMFAGYDFARRVAEVERNAAAINSRYMEAQDALSTIRGEVLLGSVYVRDALLDPDPTAAEGYRVRLKDTYAAVDVALREYVPILNPAVERTRVEQLRLEVDDFQTTMLEVLRDRSRRPDEARILLNEQVVPRRAAVIRVAEQAQQLNRAAFVAQQRAIAEIYGQLQDRVRRQLGIGLALSLGIALVAIVYSGRLERRLRRQQLKDAQNTRDLQRLSIRLIGAQEDERRKIARELHDEVGQVLMAIKVELARARRSMALRQTTEPALDEAESITDGALRVVRDLSQLLHPALLDDLGLPAALDWYVQGFRKRHAVAVDLRTDGLDDERLPPHVEAPAFRIVQEALTNVAKHARATTCELRLRRYPDRLVITIEDDGIGFDAMETERTGTQRGLGLLGIRERVAQLHGTLRLESGPDIGTKLRVELPVASPAATENVDVPVGAVSEPARELSS
ncbi:MAG: sensor histidine kinase [Acidobacteria bacterium]|nr:sensor histidine kinase [Acidobacteriota bacterium]